MAPKKLQTSSKNPNNQPDLPNNFYLLHLDNQKLTKEVQELEQITQSLIPTINKLLNEQNPQKKQNQQTSSQEMERQVTQIQWNLRKKFDQRINQLEQIQLNQRSDSESRRVKNSSFSYQKIEKDVDIVKKMDIKQTTAIYSREYNKKRNLKSIQNLMHIE